ncbi:MAG: hypothetical protein IT381_29925 [Deltaproteobacteria bacterium]|nr:hypothetical protein [Deltaproteobacteria bacterium]
MIRRLLVVIALGGCISFELTRAVQPTAPTGPVAMEGKLGLGVACTSGDECVFGFCADGVCCNSACAGQCARCDDPRHPGTCTPVPADTVAANREACVIATPACAGSCDGASEECAYKGAATPCGDNCQGTCDGAGACTASGSCPNNLACDGAACATGCTMNSQCVQFFQCVSGQCVRRPEADCLDGADDNGDTLKDCADPSCAALVECVVDPGGELGFVADTCTSDYPMVATLNKGAGPSLGAPCPHNCGCTPPPTVCDFILTFHGPEGGGDHLCLSAVTDTEIGTVVSRQTGDACAYDSNACAFDTVGIHPHSISLGAPYNPRFRELTPTYTGSATPPAPFWSTTTSFCKAAKKSSTCVPGMSCVARRTGPRCFRIPGNAICGGNFVNEEHWFADFGTDSRACEPCSAMSHTKSFSSCPTSYHLLEDSPNVECQEGFNPVPVANTAGLSYPNHPTSPPSCNNNGGGAAAACNSNGCYGNFCSLMQTATAGWGPDSCTLTSSPTLISGQVAGSGASTTCCTP